MPSFSRRSLRRAARRPSRRPSECSSRPGRLLGSAAALTTALLSCALAAPAALAAAAPAAAPSASASAAPKPPAVLFGTTDPTYDGVFRQSTALLALHAVGAPIPAAAVDWLVGQQCADGGFGAYRADVATACTAKGAKGSQGAKAAKNEDTNSTALAVQALAALGGHGAAVGRAVHWLEGQQTSGGGWGFQAGLAQDTDSTGAVIGALAAAGAKPLDLRSHGKSPTDALLALQLGCSAPAGQRGAFGYQPSTSGALAANAKATTDGILGALASPYTVTAPAGDHPVRALSCPAGRPAAAGQAADSAAAAAAGASYLAGQLAAQGQHLTMAEPGASTPVPDYGTTADAVLALAADGQHSAAEDAYRWLEQHGTSWADSGPAAAGTLILAAEAVGADPHHAGGTDLVAKLQAMGPKASASSGSGSALGWWVGGVVVVLVVIGVAVAFLRRGRQHS